MLNQEPWNRTRNLTVKTFIFRKTPSGALKFLLRNSSDLKMIRFIFLRLKIDHVVQLRGLNTCETIGTKDNK